VPHPKVPRLGDGESEETIRRFVDVRSPLETLTLVVEPGPPSPGPPTPSVALPMHAPPSASLPPPDPLLASLEASIQSLRTEQLHSARRLERALLGLGALALLALLAALVSLVLSSR
jgi:hypothetical protein